MLSRTPISLRSLALALALTLPVAALADDSEQARRLATLRAEVENLASEVDQIKDDARGELRSLELQQTDLEARIRQEEVRVEELGRLIERQKENLKAEQIAGEVLTPVLVDALARVRRSIEAGLPYHTEDRLAEVDKLAGQLQEQTLTPQRAATRIWQLIEDELRLSRENIMDRQVVVLDGSEVLVDVARIGMVLMYFRTEDGRIGAVTGKPGAWLYQVVTDSRVAQIEGLFDALEKQVRVGYFELPNTLVEGM
jgi:hypothetical protein